MLPTLPHMRERASGPVGAAPAVGGPLRHRAARRLLNVRRMASLAVRSLVASLALGSTLGFMGCDPSRPGASGTIRVAAGTDVAGFKTLALRFLPNPFRTFDPKTPLPKVEESQDGNDVPLSQVTFPYAYRIGGGIGASDIADWLLVGWLSHDAVGSAQQLAPGDVFCSALVPIKDCGSTGGHCGLTTAIECTLQGIVPPSTP